MITEDYVSFEIANLLKDKWFNEPTAWVYSNKKKGMRLSDYGIRNLTNEDCSKYSTWQFPLAGVSSIVSAPTLNVAMKWLGEKFNLFISTKFTVRGWYCDISRAVRDSDGKIIDVEDGIDDDAIPYCKTYAEAVKKALKYALEELA